MLTIRRLLPVPLKKDLLVEDVTDAHDVSDDVIISLHLAATVQ